MLEITYIITNGYVSIDTMGKFLNDGWTFVCTVPAKTAHPHALDTDKLAIFSRYTEPVIEDVKTSNPEI